MIKKIKKKKRTEEDKIKDLIEKIGILRIKNAGLEIKLANKEKAILLERADFGIQTGIMSVGEVRESLGLPKEKPTLAEEYPNKDFTDWRMEFYRFLRYVLTSKNIKTIKNTAEKGIDRFFENKKEEQEKKSE